MKTEKHFPGVRKLVMMAILLITLLVFTGCGSKKTVTQSETKEKTDIELTDNSKINTKIEQEQQYVNTNTKERIVTFYGVRMVPYPIGGDTVLIPFPYPIQKEENRDISEQACQQKKSIQDSIQNAIDLKYKSQINEKDKKINEFKQSTFMYQIAAALSTVIVIIILILYIKAKQKP